MVLLLAVRVERLADRDGDVVAHQVEQGKRAHRVVRPQRHAAVHVLRGHSGLLHQPHGVEEVGEEEAVDDEPGLVRHLNHRLADGLAPVDGARADVVRGGLGDAELDQVHAGHRVEGMQAEGALRVAGARGDLIERQRGGGGRQVGAPRGIGDRPQQLDLRLQLLDDRLHHDVARGQVRDLGGDLDPFRRRRRRASCTGSAPAPRPSRPTRRNVPGEGSGRPRWRRPRARRRSFRCPLYLVARMSQMWTWGGVCITPGLRTFARWRVSASNR